MSAKTIDQVKTLVCMGIIAGGILGVLYGGITAVLAMFV